MEDRMEQQRGLLLLLLGLQLLMMGALLCPNHHLHSFTSSLRFLTQDKPEVGEEELSFVVQESSPGIPRQDVYSNISQIHHVDIRREDLPNCPIVSPYISGPLKVMIQENLTMEQVVEKNPLVELGGQYQPPNCWTRHHTAIVVPYYGQAQHLQHLLFHLHPFLQRQQLHYAIYVVNQVNNTAFNQGKLRNVGFWEAMQEEDWDCVFFHDVNLLPEDNRNLYICDIFPAHVSVAIDKFNYKLPYRGYLGGVFALRPVHYLKINGFPNTYWDRDREDNDIAARLDLNGCSSHDPICSLATTTCWRRGWTTAMSRVPREGPGPSRQTVSGHEEEMLLRLLLLLPPVLWGGALAKDSSYRLVLQESVTVQESLCVFVPCKFSYSRMFPKYLHQHWFKIEGNKKRSFLVATNNPEEKLQERTQGRFLIPMDPEPDDCSLTIRDVNMRDSGTYFFHVKYGLYEHTYEDQMLSLKVTGPLESGRLKKLNCFVLWACEEGTPPIFSWTSAAHTFLGPRSHHLSSVLTLIPRPQDHSTNLTCQVHFPATGVSVERTIRLNVAYAPQNMAIRVFQGNSTALKILQTTSLSILEGEALRLRCEADSNPPAELSWFRGSPGLHATPITSTAILELPRVGPAQEGEFTCQARHKLGSLSVSLSLSVVYPPQLLGPSCSWEDQGLHCSCSSRAQPAPSLRWRLGAGLLEGNHGNASHVVNSSSEGPWTNSSLSLRAGLSEGLRLSCEAQNVHGTRSTAVLLLPDPPQLLGPSCSWEDQGLHCSCSSRAQPAPSLRWRLGAGLLEGNHGNASHAVSSSSEGPWTNSSLSLRQRLSPDLRLSCEAWNVHGAQSVSVLLLPGQEEKDLIAKGFSKGIALGTGVTILLALGLCLCLILAVVKTLRKTQTQTPAEEAAPETETPARTETWRPRLTRRSTILDYINVVPNARGLARNPKAKPSSPSRAPPAGANSPGRNMSPPAPESRNSQQEIHYAALSFPGLRPQEAQQAKDNNSEYAEIRFH
ncbi:PREDICTED: sialic acid-binding Ig-like lectin 10 isoform X4 [Myotis brandtii]|uniref:sialic acid-binding Ig-like lectin 10 isoform X4 n=1 Tax=Myotis brandtii TaxID=109478 RepID=UPI0007040762|nr:PREDICTED: sialic acid-binding Ig-like lectin 10 isoform X4 [Myotis brandtii]